LPRVAPRQAHRAHRPGDRAARDVPLASRLPLHLAHAVDLEIRGILLVPALAFLWALWSKLGDPVAPRPVPLTLTGAGAGAINLFCL